MDKIIVNESRIEEYLNKMSSYLKEYVSEIAEMNQLKNTMDLEDKSISMIYNNVLNEYIAFAQKMFAYLEFLDKYVDKYNEKINSLKADLSKINNRQREYDKYKCGQGTIQWIY